MKNYENIERISVQSIPLGSGSDQVILGTPNGDIECIYHSVGEPRGVIWVSGARGGFDGPSSGVYSKVSRELVSKGMNSLRLNYRFPGELDHCITDVLIAIRFLDCLGIDRIALVGHSFGGAVVIMAGIMTTQVKAVVALSSQTLGAQRVNELSPTPLLLVHGDNDRILPSSCSKQIYRWAGEPKELVIYRGSGHLLEECKEELHDLLKNWLVDKLD